jgi:hypothetical protein
MGLVVLAVVLTADRLLVDLPVHARVGGAVFVLTFPIVGTLPYHFRPDATGGLATGFGVLMMLRHSPFRVPRTHQYVTGVCFALAFLIKPSAAPFTLWMFVGSWALSILAGGMTDRFVSAASTVQGRGDGRQGYWAAIWPYWAPVLLLAGPYYLLAGGTVYRYIYENVFGQNREVWRLKRDWLSLARFIVDGEGGQLMLRRHAYLVVGLASCAAVLHMVGRRGTGVDRERLRGALALIGALFLAWLFPSLSRYGNPFTGSTFAAILLFIGVLLLRSLFVVGDVFPRVEGRRRILGPALGWSVITVAVLAFVWPAPLGTKASDWVLNDNRVERAVYRAIADHAAGKDAKVFVTSAANLNAHLLQFRARVDHVQIAWRGPPFSRDIRDYRGPIATSDYVVSGDQGAFREGRHLPFYEMQGLLVTELKADPSFTLLTSVPTHQGLNIYVFARKPR